MATVSRRYRSVVLVLTGFLLALALLAVGVAMTLRSIFGFPQPSLASRLQDYQRVIADIESGEIAADGSGNCVLGPAFAKLTPRGNVLVDTTAEGRTLILFPTWVGRGGDLDGYLYASGGLAPRDFYTVDWGASGQRRHVDVATAEMLDVTSVQQNWYWASRRLD